MAEQGQCERDGRMLLTNCERVQYQLCILPFNGPPPMRVGSPQENPFSLSPSPPNVAETLDYHV